MTTNYNNIRQLIEDDELQEAIKQIQVLAQKSNKNKLRDSFINISANFHSNKKLNNNGARSTIKYQTIKRNLVESLLHLLAELEAYFSHQEPIIIPEMITFNGEQFEAFSEALLSAYPNFNALKRLVKFKLNKNLNTISAERDLANVVFKLIEYYDNNGELALLVNAVYADKPNNFQLKVFVENLSQSTTIHKEKNQITTKQSTTTMSMNPFIVLILTAISKEYMAVRRHLTNLDELELPNGTIYEKGTYRNHNIIIAEIGMGNSNAAMQTERAITHVSPHLILFVGVAGGVKDVRLGDIVVGEKVYGYESGKIADDGFFARPSVGQSSFKVVQRAKAEAKKRDWTKLLLTDSAKENKVLIGNICAGEKLVATTNSEIYRRIKKYYNDTHALEMEGRGCLAAAFQNNVQVGIIREISDLLNDKSKADDKGYQEIAVAHAAAFAFCLIEKLAKNHKSQSDNFIVKGHNNIIINNVDHTLINQPTKINWTKLETAYSNSDFTSILEMLDNHFGDSPTYQYSQLKLTIRHYLGQGLLPPPATAQGLKIFMNDLKRKLG